MRAVGVFVDVAGCVCGGFVEKRLKYCYSKKRKSWDVMAEVADILL
jgi:hypothetical protein